jgi:hypothetical protein
VRNELALFHDSPLRGGWHRAKIFSAAAIVSLTVGACGSDGPVAPAEGTGSLTTTGAVNLSGSGPADFQQILVGREPTFGITISHFTQFSLDWELQIVKNNSSQLGAGTYDLVPQSESTTNPTALLTLYTSGTEFQSFNSTSGSLVITSSSPSEMRGTFTFLGTDGTNSVSANGSFDACATHPCQ